MPPVALTPRPMGSSPHVGESDMDGGRSGLPDLSREGPFDVHQDRPHSGASPAYGVQLHDPRLLEYVGAPESAHLLSRSPEYWLHHFRPLYNCSMRLV